MKGAAHRQRLDAVWARHKKGELAFAYGAYRELLRERPDDPATLHYLGVLAWQTGHAGEALRLIGRSISLDPSDSRAFNHLGQIHASRRAWGEAEDCFRKALEADPGSTDALNNLGNILKRRGRPLEALPVYRRAVQLAPHQSHCHYNLAQLLRDLRQFEDAMEAYRQAIATDASNSHAHYELGLCLEELGRFEEAVDHYQETLRLRPDHARAVANLLSLRSFQPSESFISHAAALARRPNLREEQRAKLHNALGKHFDRGGRYDEAFAHFAACNAAQQSGRPPFERARLIESTERIIACYGREHFRRVRDFGHPSTRPIFIVGLPRSGTTLTEQILASHSEVHGGGELPEMPRLADTLLEGGLGSIAPSARRYLDALDAVAPRTALRVTDKLPLNYLHLGAVATFFPNARIVHCRRDPRDVLLSCFIEMFSTVEQDFTKLESIAEIIIQEARLMTHWRTVLPLSIHEVHYEKLIADQTEESRRLIEFCGLGWEENCLRYFDTKRFVDTPSRWQVRQPIYTSSKGRWRNYASHLAPAIATLEASGLVGAPES